MDFYRTLYFYLTKNANFRIIHYKEIKYLSFIPQSQIMKLNILNISLQLIFS
jgi:hypothetical protein